MRAQRRVYARPSRTPCSKNGVKTSRNERTGRGGARADLCCLPDPLCVELGVVVLGRVRHRHAHPLEGDDLCAKVPERSSSGSKAGLLTVLRLLVLLLLETSSVRLLLLLVLLRVLIALRVLRLLLVVLLVRRRSSVLVWVRARAE